MKGEEVSTNPARVAADQNSATSNCVLLFHFGNHAHKPEDNCRVQFTWVQRSAAFPTNNDTLFTRRCIYIDNENVYKPGTGFTSPT